MENAAALKLFKNVLRHLNSFITRNEKKTARLEGIQFLMDILTIKEGEEKAWDEDGNEIKQILLGVLPPQKLILDDEYFEEPLFLVWILF